MAAVADDLHSPPPGLGGITEPFEFPEESKLTFVNVRGLDDATPSLEDIGGIQDELLWQVRVGWMRFSYEPLDLIEKGDPQNTASSLARELLGQIRDEYSSCDSAYIVLCASDIGALVVKEALIMAAVDPAYEDDDLLSKIALVVFFGSPHRTKTTAGMVSIIHSLLQTFHPKDSRCVKSPQNLTELAGYCTNLASQFEKAPRPYRVISCFQQCGPDTPHTQVVPELHSRTFVAEEIPLGLDRTHGQLHAGIAFDEKEFWRIHFEDACTRKLSAYQQLTRALNPRYRYPSNLPRSRQTFRNLAESILKRGNIQKWAILDASARRLKFLHFTQPRFPVRPDEFGHAISSALHPKINKNILFQPITIYIDAAKHDANGSDTRVVSEVYGLLCAELLAQQPSLAMHLRDIDVSELAYTREQNLFTTLSTQLRGLLVKLLSCQRARREIYIVINFGHWSDLVHDILNTLSCVVNSTDSPITVVLLSTQPAQEDPSAPCHLPVLSAVSFCTEILDGMDISSALNQDIRDWLAASNTRIPPCKEAESEALSRLEATTSWSEAEQFLIYLEQLPDLGNSLLPLLPPRQSSTNRLTRAISTHGNWLLVALLWIYHANRPLTLDELDEAVSFDLSLGPELMSVLLSEDYPPSAQSVSAVWKNTATPEVFRSMVAADIIRILPGVVVIDDGRVLPVDENTRHYLADPMNLKSTTACSPSDFLALSCLLRIENQLFEDANFDLDNSIGIRRLYPTRMTDYALMSWAEHFSTSLPPQAVNRVRQTKTLYGDVNLALEDLATKFLNAPERVEKWLNAVKISIAKLSGPQTADGYEVDRNVLPSFLQRELGIPMRQAAHLSERLLSRSDTWNSLYDSILLEAVETDDKFLWNALRDYNTKTNTSLQAETIAGALLAASPEMKDQLNETLRDLFPQLNPNMTLYCVASHDPSIVPSVDFGPKTRSHFEYLLRVATRLGDVLLLEKVLECVDTQGADEEHTAAQLLSDSELIPVAAVSGQIKALQTLLQTGAPMHSQTRSGFSAVMLASIYGFADIVDVLLKFDASSIDSKSTNTAWAGQTALHLSSRSGFFKTVNVLLRNKADPLLANAAKNLPLHSALIFGHLEVAELLLNNMPDYLSCERTAQLLARKLSLRPESNDEDQDTDTDCSDTESDSDAMSDSVHTGDREVSDNVTEGQTICPFNIRNSDRTTAFILAACQGFVSICDKMLARHADPKLVDGTEMSALDHAALCGSEDLIDLLLKHQPDLATQQKSPRTVLYHAAISGHPHITQRLLDLNNDLVNHLDEDDELLPLQKAITLGHDKVVDVIVRRCLKADVKHKALVKGLSCATRQGKASLMELLLDLGVDIDGFDRYKNTALHFAAYNNTVPQVEILIMRKAQLDCRDEDGYTPLMDAARSGSPPSVRLLINAGANLEALTDFGASALDLAIAHGKRECGQLLLARLLQRHPDWFKSSKRDCKPYLQFSVECSALELAQNIIEVVVEKNSKDIDNPSVKQFVSSLLWNKWQAALDFFWNTWDVSTNELGIYGTALHYAAMRYQTSVVETILTHPKHPIDVNNKSGKYGTALQAIVVIQPKANYVEARKFLDMVDLLLKHEADIKVVGKPMTYVLQAALFQRRKDLSLSLLEKLRSKDILRVGGQYQTVLRALLAGPPHGDDVVEELIDLLLDKHGESVSRGTKGANGGGTALHQAAETASVRVIQHLMKLNDKPNVEIDIHQADMMGRLPIHFTIRSSQDRWEIAKTLDPDLATLWEKDQMHRTILHFAAVRRNVVMAKRALEVARDASLDVRKVLNETDIDGWTPIHWACRSGDNDEMIELLTTNGANVDARTRDNWLPWHVAVFHNQNYLRPQGGHDKDEDSDDQESSSDTREGLPTRAAPEIGALCNSCWSNCFGDAWHCTTCTKEHHLIEFDLCFKCYPYKEKLHPADHEFEQMPEDWYWTFRQTKAAMFQDFDKK